MTKIIRSDSVKRSTNSKIIWLILIVIINSAGLFLVVNWYGQFAKNQRPIVNIDESLFSIFANSIASQETLTQDQRKILQSSLSNQTVDEFLSLDLLNSNKFKNLRTYYTPPELDEEDLAEILDGLVVGNPRPFNY